MKELPSAYAPQDIDQKWKKIWNDSKVFRYKKSVPRAETFAIDTPPPTVSGSLHLGHMFSYTQTDVIARFQRMRGKNVFYPMGWDDNGLPTERRVQNVFGIRCNLDKAYQKNWRFEKKDQDDSTVEEVSRENFIEACTALTLEDEAVFKETFQRLGLSVDWEQEYSTINSDSRKVAQLSFIKLFKQGDVGLYESPTMWDIDFQTAVAQAEVEDREVGGFYHDIIFHLEDEGEFTISTTRPELLPACIAIVAHPDDERYQAYFGKYAFSPLFQARIPILAATHADPEKGTGILMVCTFGDTHDVEWWKQSKLPARQIIQKDGTIKKVIFGEGSFESIDCAKANSYMQQLWGLHLKPAAKKMAEFLKNEGLLVGEPRAIKRPVKFFEKGARPLEYMTSRQWFTHILKHKNELIEQGRKIQWHPEHMRQRYENWVENLNSDWCISRQRFFGVPFPVWYPINENGLVDYQNPILANESSLPVDPLNDVPPGYKAEQRGVSGGFVAERDVMDTWATSSLTPQLAAKWGDDQESLMDNIFPMDVRPQSHEIIRTWAFYTIVKSHLHLRTIPWRHVTISGWILDPDRKKMSKSKGNVVTPEKYLEDYGSDAFRYWAAKAKLGVDTAFDEGLFKIGKKLCNKLFHASRFVTTQLQMFQKPSSIDESQITAPLDLFWIQEVKQMIVRATRSFESFDYSDALLAIEESFWKFCDDYIEMVKVRSYSQEDEEGRNSALETLNWTLQVYTRAFAPFMPFLCEEIWSWRNEGDFERENSVHLMKWPGRNELKVGTEREDDISPWALVCSVVGAVRGEKTKQQKTLRWPVKNLKISAPDYFVEVFDQTKKDIFACCHIQTDATVEFSDNVAGLHNVACEVVLSELGPEKI